MAEEQTAAADGTAVRVALWRALHVLLDAPPHVLEDEIGLQLAAPADGWRDRGDMHPAGTGPFRAPLSAGLGSSRIWSRAVGSPSVTSPAGPMAFARPVERICWWPRPDR
jgi:hypothetical protein